jgi:general secretion pathway protein C
LGLNLQGKKLVVAIVLSTLTLCALFLAQGATTLAATSFFPSQNVVSFDSDAKSAASVSSPGSRMPDVKAILSRNIFDSTTGPLWPPPETNQPSAAEEQIEELPPDPFAPPPPCETTSIKMVASVCTEKLPEWSFVALSNGSGPPMLYRQGSQLDGWEIVAIYPKAVYLKPSGGRSCSLALFEDLKSAASAQTASAEPAPGATSGPVSGQGGLSEQELSEGINAVSETEFGISRGLIDKVLQNQAELMRSARVVPHEINGQVVGVKLYGIRRSSLLGRLGLQNGDLLRTINGYDMSRPDSALEAYSRLRGADNLTVAVQRRGQNLNVSYHIR